MVAGVGIVTAAFIFLFGGLSQPGIERPHPYQ